MLKRIFVSAAAWTGLGLTSGVFYREFTKLNRYTETSMLNFAHTHALALGTLMLLIVLALVKAFSIDDRRLSLWLWLWNIGVGVTFGMLVIKGTLQVIKSPIVTSAALPGIAGLGHIIVTIAFVLLLVIVGKSVSRDASSA